MWTLYAQCMCAVCVPKQGCACVRVCAYVRACTCSNVHIHAWRFHSLFTASCHKFTKSFLLCLKHWLSSCYFISFQFLVLACLVCCSFFFNFFVISFWVHRSRCKWNWQPCIHFVSTILPLMSFLITLKCEGFVLSYFCVPLIVATARYFQRNIFFIVICTKTCWLWL